MSGSGEPSARSQRSDDQPSSLSAMPDAPIRPATERSLAASFLLGHRELTRLLEADIEETGLDGKDALFLRILALNRNVPIGAIAEALGLAASTDTYVVDRLCQGGLITRDFGSPDRRLAVVRLTVPGQEAARLVIRAMRDLDKEIVDVAGTTAEHVSLIVDAVELLASRERKMRHRRWGGAVPSNWPSLRAVGTQRASTPSNSPSNRRIAASSAGSA